MIELFKKRDYFGIAVFLIALAALVWFFAAKITLFNKLAYQSDLFSHIQISRSWLEGRPAMFENNYGNHATYHNYFFNLLIGPFVLWWGAYGIFLSQFLVYAIALWYSFPIIYKKTTHKKYLVVVFYLVLFFGPYGFWLYDDTWFGFHIEMLYIPLGLVFSLALLQKQKWVAVLSGILIISIKEDGVVLLACLHLLYLVWQNLQQHITQKQWLKKSLVWGAVYLAVFALGILYLKYKNNFANTRLDLAFAKFAEMDSKVKVDYFKDIFLNFGLLLLPMLAAFVYLKIKPKFLLWWLLLLVPITIVNTISGLYYLPYFKLSITWVPRFALTYALFLGALVCLFTQPVKGWLKKENIFITIGVGIVLFAGQWFVLKKAVNYSFTDNAITIFAKPHPEKEKPYLVGLRKLAKVLPYSYPIAPPYALFGYFHKQDYMWISSAYRAWQAPRIVITDETLWAGVNPTDKMQQPDSVITEHINYYFEKEDRHYLIKADIIK